MYLPWIFKSPHGFMDQTDNEHRSCCWAQVQSYNPCTESIPDGNRQPDFIISDKK